jgi:DNA-binding ferritin-like protein
MQAWNGFEKMLDVMEAQGKRQPMGSATAFNQMTAYLLNQCFAAAEQENRQGIADFIAGRIDAMGKHGWMLRSFLKDQRA